MGERNLGETLDGLSTITPQNSLVGSVTNAGLGRPLKTRSIKRFWRRS